jgi:hypothetical protein
VHARLAEAIEALHRDRLGEHVERLAHHAHPRRTGDKAGAPPEARLRRGASRRFRRPGWLESTLATLDAPPGRRH